MFGAHDSCIAYLKEEFLDMYPLFNMRLEFFRIMQPKKQSMSDSINQCRQLWNEGDLHNLQDDNLLLFKYFYACTDDELCKKMLKVEDPTAIKIEGFVSLYEVSRRANKEVTKSSPQTQTAQAAQAK